MSQPVGTRTFALDAVRAPIQGCPVTVRAIVAGETGDKSPACSWCDNIAEYVITVDHLDLVDVACQEHRERYWGAGVSLIKPDYWAQFTATL